MRKNSGTDTSGAAAPVPRYRGMLSQERNKQETAAASTPKQKKMISDKKAGFELAITGSGSSAKQSSTSKGTV